jgi:hypothetical protein
VLSPQVQFARTGQFLLVLRVDQVQLAEWPLRVSAVPHPPHGPTQAAN